MKLEIERWEKVIFIKQVFSIFRVECPYMVFSSITDLTGGCMTAWKQLAALGTPANLLVH